MTCSSSVLITAATVAAVPTPETKAASVAEIARPVTAKGTAAIQTPTDATPAMM